MDVGFQNMKFEQLSLLFIGGSEGVRIYNYESAAEPGCATRKSCPYNSRGFRKETLFGVFVGLVMGIIAGYVIGHWGWPFIESGSGGIAPSSGGADETPVKSLPFFDSP